MPFFAFIITNPSQNFFRICNANVAKCDIIVAKTKFKAIPHNSKCRYGERGTADAKPKAQIILCVLSSILATQMPCRTPSRSEALRSATAACGGSWRGDPSERCLSRQAGIVRCCLNYTAFISALQAHRRRKGCKKHPLPRFAKKIPPPDTGSGAFLNESNPSGICARSMRCGLLYCVFSRRAARISFWIAGVVSIFCINAASSSGSCFAGSCSATTAARYSAWDIAGSKVRA